MTNPALQVFWIRIDILLFLWIPFAAGYSLNRPKRKMGWIILMLAMLVSFAYGLLSLERYYSTTYLAQLLLTAFVTVMVSEFIRNKRTFWVGIAKALFIMVFEAGVLWFVLKSEEAFLWRWENMDISFKACWWGSLNEHCKQVLQQAKWIGSTEMEEAIRAGYPDAFALDYLRRYFINFLIQEHGLILGIVAAAISVSFVWALVSGARRQLCKIDRCICMSCAAYFAVQLVIALPANFGLQWIPPYVISFLGANAGFWYTDMLALSVYMAFYKAHKQTR